MAEFSVPGPLNEGCLHDYFWFDPMRAQTRQAFRFGEWRFLDFDLIELRAHIKQQLRIKARSDLAGKSKVIAVVVADQERAETDSLALRIGEATDDELLGQLAFHLQPERRAARFID